MGSGVKRESFVVVVVRNNYNLSAGWNAPLEREMEDVEKREESCCLNILPTVVKR